VNSGAEADVARRTPPDIEPVRLRPGPRIAVRGAKEQQDLRAGRDGRAGDLDRARRNSSSNGSISTAGGAVTGRASRDQRQSWS